MLEFCGKLHSISNNDHLDDYSDENALAKAPKSVSALMTSGLNALSCYFHEIRFNSSVVNAKNNARRWKIEINVICSQHFPTLVELVIKQAISIRGEN